MVFKGMGRRILDLRRERGWSQNELARRAQLTDGSHVGRIEREIVGVKEDALQRLAEAFEVHPLWLATGEGPKEIGEGQLAVLSNQEGEVIDRWRGMTQAAQRCIFPVMQFFYVLRGAAPFRELCIHELAVAADSPYVLSSVADISVVGVDGKRRGHRSTDATVEGPLIIVVPPEPEDKKPEAPVVPLRRPAPVEVRKTIAAAAGPPIESDRQPDVDGVPPELLEAGISYQLATAKGDSMIGIGINDGDELLTKDVRESHNYQAGDVVVAEILEGVEDVPLGFTCKRFAGTHRTITRLLSENPEVATINVPRAFCRIDGVVVARKDKEGKWHRVERESVRGRR